MKYCGLVIDDWCWENEDKICLFWLAYEAEIKKNNRKSFWSKFVE